MKILNLLFFITVAILASCGGADIQSNVEIEGAAVSKPNQIKPHIVFILLDDLGVDAGPCSNDLSLMTNFCLLYTSPSPRDRQKSRMPSSA